MRHLVRPSALVAAFFDTLQPEQAEAVRAVQRAVLAAAPVLEQSVKWGNLTFMLRGRNLMAISLHRHHVHLQFFNGALLAPRFEQLEGVGRGMRQLRWRNGQPLDEGLIRDLVLASVGAAQDRPQSLGSHEFVPIDTPASDKEPSRRA
jgi:hypothetical protein